MYKLFITSLIAACLLVPAGARDASAAWIWSPESGEWADMKDGAKDTPEQQFMIAKGFFDEGKFDRSATEFDKLIKHYPNSRWAAGAQYHKGMIFEKEGETSKAADAFRILIDRYPYSENLNDAVEHEFELAEAMASGRKTKFLGMAIIPARDRAVEAYRHIVRSAPYGPYGALAQYRLAETETELGNFEEAKAAFQAVIDEYPNSEYSPKAKFKIAQTTYQSALIEENDEMATEEAISKFEGFKKAYPDSYLQFDADEAIRELREKKAEDLYSVAVFYEEREKYPSAALYYNDVIDQFPETKAAAVARERLTYIDAIEREGARPQKRKFMGFIPVKERVDLPADHRPGFFDLASFGKDPMKKAAPREAKKASTFSVPPPRLDAVQDPDEKPKKFLGIFPMGEKMTAPEVTVGDEPGKFLGLFPIGAPKPAADEGNSGGFDEDEEEGGGGLALPNIFELFSPKKKADSADEVAAGEAVDVDENGKKVKYFLGVIPVGTEESGNETEEGELSEE